MNYSTNFAISIFPERLMKENDRISKDFEEELKEKQNSINSQRKKQEDCENELKKQIAAIDVYSFFLIFFLCSLFAHIPFFLFSMRTKV